MFGINKNFLFIIFGLIVIFTPSCIKIEPDVLAPALQFTHTSPGQVTDTVCGTSEDGVFRLQGGQQFVLGVQFEDDRELSQAKIDIHNNFDCHGHGGASTPGFTISDINAQTEDWTVLQIQELSGIKEEWELSLSVPENVTSGFYHFQIQVIDASGNDNPNAYVYTLNIQNPIDTLPPEISISTPLSDKLNLSKGQKIAFKGMVNDNYSLSEGGNGILFLSYTDLQSGNSFATDAVFPYDAAVHKNYEFDFEYTIPQTLVSGKYHLSLHTHDGVRNVAKPLVFEVDLN